MSVPLGKFFVLHPTGVAGCQLETEGGSAESGTAVVTRRPSGTEGDALDAALWWEDRVNTSIRCKLNNLCLTADKEGRIFLHAYQPMNRGQRWRFDGHVIMSGDGERVLGLDESEGHPGGYMYAQDRDDCFNEDWEKEHVDAQVLQIRNCSTDQVLDVAGASKEAGTRVIVYDRWAEVQNNQLWYEDEEGILHSRLNHYSLTSKTGGGAVSLYPYKVGEAGQQWVVSQQAIVNRRDPDLVLDIHKPMALFKKIKQTEVVAKEYNGGGSQRWEFFYTRDNDQTFGPRSYLVHLRHNTTGLYLTALPLASLGIPSERVDAALMPQKPNAFSDQLWILDGDRERIESAVDGRVLDLSGREAVLAPPSDTSPDQRWRLIAMTIQSCRNNDLHLGPAGGVRSPDQDGILRMVARVASDDEPPDLWTIVNAPPRYFYIVSQHCDCVLDVKSGEAESGGHVIIFPRKPGPPEDNQLWYEDQERVLRSKLNDYRMFSTGSKLVMQPYEQGNPHQQWVVSDDVIKNRAQPDLVLDIKGESRKPATPVIPFAFHGASNQTWRLEYIDSQ